MTKRLTARLILAKQAKGNRKLDTILRRYQEVFNEAQRPIINKILEMMKNDQDSNRW